MKINALCARCVRDCKQDPSVSVVSCPAFSSAEKNMELFDMQGNVRARAVAKKKRGRPPSPQNPTPAQDGGEAAG